MVVRGCAQQHLVGRLLRKEPIQQLVRVVDIQAADMPSSPRRRDRGSLLTGAEPVASS